MKKVLEPMFSGLKKTLSTTIDNTLLKPVKILENLLKKIWDGIELATKALVKATTQLATYMLKIPKLITATASALFDSIILPMLEVFKGFGDIFLGLLELLKIIIQKIMSIPQCIGVYAYHGGKSFFENVFIPMSPSWLRTIITLTKSFISFMFNTIYWILYFMVYPLKLFGWDIFDNLKDFFKNDCMTINFKPALRKMKDGLLMLIPKFNLKIKIKI